MSANQVTPVSDPSNQELANITNESLESLELNTQLQRQSNQTCYIEIQTLIQREEEMFQIRKVFLINFYQQLLKRILIIIAFQLLSFVDDIKNIVIGKIRLCNLNFYNNIEEYFIGFQDYAKTHIWNYQNNQKDYQFTSHDFNSYEQWRNEKLEQSAIQLLIFWVTLACLIFTMVLTHIFRRTKFIKYTQTFNFYFQNILMGLLIMAITGKACQDNQFSQIIWIKIWIMLGSLSVAIVQLICIKFKYLKLNISKVISPLLLLSLIINLFLCLTGNKMPSFSIFIELLLPYSVYYFYQLNQSIFYPIFKEDMGLTWKQQIKNFFISGLQSSQEQQVQDKIESGYVVIKKTKLNFGLTLIVYAVVVFLCIFYLSYLLIPVIVCIQVLALLIQTQIISNSKNIKIQNDEINLSVCLMPLDMFFPIKNIIRSQWRGLINQ